MSGLLGDVKYALRSLLARPLFMLVAALSLGLGIGVNTAIYSLYHQVVLRPLPVPQAQDLINLSAPGQKNGSTSNNGAGSREDIFSYPMFRDLERDVAQSEGDLLGIAAHRYLAADVVYGKQTRSGTAMLVSGEYFRLLQLQPTLGRLLDRNDDGAVGAAPVAVLSHAYWRNTLGAAADVVNRSLRVNGQTLTIVGVAPEGFTGTTFGADADVFVPLTQRWQLQPRASRDDEDRASYWLYLFARLKPGGDQASASSALNATYSRILRAVELPLQRGLDEARRDAFAAKRVTFAPGALGQSSASAQARTPLALLLCGAALVLLVACLNIANLMLARGAARAGEVALRASIGASRARLVRQWLVESALIAGFGFIASVPLALATLQILGTQIPMREVSSFALTLDPVALRFAALLGLATVALFGLFPALHMARTQPALALRGESARSGGSRGAARFRSALAIGQVALSMASLALAGLFLRSLANLDAVDLGLDTEPVAMFMIAPERSGYSPERAALLFDQLETDLAALPGVEAVSSSMVPILSNNEWGTNISLKDVPRDSETAQSLAYNRVGPGFFRTFAMPLLAGRSFEEADAAGRPKVAIVNRAFAQLLGLGPNPVGQRMAMGSQDELDIEIVSLVEDSSYSSIRAAAPPQFFLPRRQDSVLGEAVFYVRSAADPVALLPQLKAAVARLDPNLPVQDLQTMPQQIAQTLGTERFVGTLSLGFAVLATALAALGLYGVLSYTLAQRLREFGLRLALGAAPPRLRAMVLRQVAVMTAFGAVLGLGLAVGLGRAAQALLFGLQGHDPLAMSIALALLVAVAFAAGWWPARRAMRVDPAVALRSE
jgi:predicted permease